MFYKLSNTASLRHLEDAFNAKFRYSLLYEENALINGLTEQTLPIITKDDPDTINYGIWGLLPQDYREDWSNFQSLNNTLNISADDRLNLDWVNQLPLNQRCVIIVTGYFTTYLYKGEVYPFYVHKKHHEPFALGGIYSVLNDGFLSVALITTENSNQLNEVHNIGHKFPVAMSSSKIHQWFSGDMRISDEDLNKLPPVDLEAYTISKEFYKNDIVFDSILEPAHYKNLPILSLK